MTTGRNQTQPGPPTIPVVEPCQAGVVDTERGRAAGWHNLRADDAAVSWMIRGSGGTLFKRRGDGCERKARPFTEDGCRIATLEWLWQARSGAVMSCMSLKCLQIAPGRFEAQQNQQLINSQK
jgi:hypothetical protein